MPRSSLFVVVFAFLLMLLSFRSLTDRDHLDRAQPAVGGRRVRHHGRGLPARLGRVPGGHGGRSARSSPWLPLFLFVILFGLSMDYHVFVVSRIREAHDCGAAARGTRSSTASVATAGVVTSAAVIMVAVFAIFGTLSMQDMKQMGVGLAVAVLIDATIVRGVLLPAVMALLGERNWYLPKWLHRMPDLTHDESPEAAAAPPVTRDAKDERVRV